MLKENARIPYVQIARRIGISETAVRKRIRKMEENGIIKRYTIEIDPKKVGFEIDAFIGIDTKPEKYISTIEKLNQMAEVISLSPSSGDHMILIECWFKNSAELSRFVRLIEKMDGVTKVCPAIISEKIK
jgi:Lrp/AsnC family transcriptional regulator for asnA, asnC and gidA